MEDVGTDLRSPFRFNVFAAELFYFLILLLRADIEEPGTKDSLDRKSVV